MLPLHKNDEIQALSRTLFSLSFPLHLYGSLTKQKTEQLYFILLLNQTTNGVALFCLANAEWQMQNRMTSFSKTRIWGLWFKSYCWRRAKKKYQTLKLIVVGTLIQVFLLGLLYSYTCSVVPCIFREWRLWIQLTTPEIRKPAFTIYHYQHSSR